MISRSNKIHQKPESDNLIQTKVTIQSRHLFLDIEMGGRANEAR